jgi:hypothetical protein
MSSTFPWMVPMGRPFVAEQERNELPKSCSCERGQEASLDKAGGRSDPMLALQHTNGSLIQSSARKLKL